MTDLEDAEEFAGVFDEEGGICHNAKIIYHVP